VLNAMGGPAAARDNYRLFMVPGMGHCRGGAGTATFDILGALEKWVERGQAPDRIPASRTTNGQIDRTRPLCPYPQVATYTGSRSTNDASNFICK
jgi:feruloyl esterase